MKRDGYPAARAVAPKLYEYFARRRAEAQQNGQERLAALPDTKSIEVLIDAAFWGSLRREEGYSPRISMAFLAPREAQHPIRLERPLPLLPAVLSRVSPAVERPGVHLGVWGESDGLAIWGTTGSVPVLCLVVEVSAPGLLVVKHHTGEESRKFVNVAVLEGDQIKLVDERISRVPQSPSSLTSLLGFDSAASWLQSVNTMVRLAVSMRAHGRGGSLLVVPAGTDAWRESIVQPMPYAAAAPFVGVEAPGPTIATVAGLSAVDGAVVLNDRYELLGFGAKIARRKRFPQVEQVTLQEPVEGSRATLMHPEQLGGTRHLSAAQFIQDQRDAVALVASQDGRFTVFEWSQADNLVRAHRLDVLLL